MVLIKGAMLEADRDNEDLRITLEVFSLSPSTTEKPVAITRIATGFI